MVRLQAVLETTLQAGQFHGNVTSHMAFTRAHPTATSGRAQADFPRAVALDLLLAPRCCGSWFLLLFRFCSRRGRFGRNAVSGPKLAAPYGADKRASGWLFGLGLSGGSMFCSRRILRKAGTDQCKNETCCRGYLFHLRFASSPISMLLGRPPKAGEPCQKAEAVTKERGPVCLGDRASQRVRPSHPRARP